MEVVGSLPTSEAAGLLPYAVCIGATVVLLCRPLTSFRILVFLVFTTFQTSFLLLFTVPWTCPIIGQRVNKELSYFPGKRKQGST